MGIIMKDRSYCCQILFKLLKNGITEIHYLGIYAVMIKLGVSWLPGKHGAIPNNFEVNFCQWKHSAYYLQQANKEQDPEGIESQLLLLYSIQFCTDVVLLETSAYFHIKF